MRLRIAQIVGVIVFLSFQLTGCGSSRVSQSAGNSQKIDRIGSFTPQAATYHPSDWTQLPGWSNEDFEGAWSAWMNSCKVLSRQRDGLNWRSTCERAQGLNKPNRNEIKAYFEANFRVLEVRQANDVNQYRSGSNLGLITGYYEPEILGSLTRRGIFQTPLYAYPAAWRNNKPSKYPTRKELLSGNTLLGSELVWVADPVAAAFMQVQGSGQIRLESGEIVRLGFAGTNEHEFKSFAQWLIDRGELTRSQASMQSIQKWAKSHPHQVAEMLDANPRYIFFKILSTASAKEGPPGSIGVPLTPERSIAVDWKSIPQGAPVFLSTTHPDKKQPLQRLVFAQDTGSAIIGGVRADYYWGSGADAGEKAGRMKQAGKMWVILPQ